MAQPNSPNVVSTPAVAGQSNWDATSSADTDKWQKVSVPRDDKPMQRGSGAADIHTGRLSAQDNWVVTHRTEQSEGGWSQT
jgi:hypothetical protein